MVVGVQKGSFLKWKRVTGVGLLVLQLEKEIICP